MADPILEQESRRRRILGWSAACDPIAPGTDNGRDLRLEKGPSGLDLARTDGIDNLNQSLAIALTTLLGSDIFNVDFGFDGLRALVEETHPVMTAERIRIAVIQTVRKDPRIRRIIDVQLADNRLQLPGASAGTGSRELDVRVAFEAHSGDQLNVDIGRLLRG